MVFRTDNIKRKFKYKSTVSTPSSSSHGPNRISNVTTHKINRPVTINQVATQTRTNSLSGASLSLGGSGNGQPYIPESITTKQEKPINSQPDFFGRIATGFNTWKDDTFMSFADKNAIREADAVKLESNIITSKYPESTTPTNLKETASGTDFNSGTDLQGRQDAHAANLGIITSQPRSYTKGMEARGVSSNVSMGWNLESKPTGSTKASSISNIVQQQKNTNLHNDMVDQWQSEFLTNASRDSGAASTWLTDQTVKINSWEGSDRSKNVLKKDLNKRYDDLFKSDSAPFKSNKGNPSLGQGLSYAEKKEATRLAKESAAMNASYIYGPNTNYQMNPQGQPPQGPMPGISSVPSQNKGSLMDGYNNLGKLGSLEYMFGSKNKDKPGNVSF